MKATITGFANSPDRGNGLARDMGVRWACEEVSLPYEMALLSFDELKQPPHRAIHPFGQIPTYVSGDLALFESGAIVLHIAQNHPGLLPAGPAVRARAISWMFAAVATVEPVIVEFDLAPHVEGDRPWHRDRLPLLADRVRLRLNDLALWLGDGEWLEADFGAGDLMMVMALRRLDGSGLLEECPALRRYVDRAQARPAFQRAFAAQRAIFEATNT